MGFFDRLAAKKTPPSSKPESSPAADTATPASSINVSLVTARQKLDAKDLPGALAIYDEVLRFAGDRADVLVTISGDLGATGHVEQIVDLIAPRYDAERHGPATGLNLLQAYLATHNSGAAQHLLDILFGLRKPELEVRLHGFSNALAELIEAERTGMVAPNGVGSNDENIIKRVTVALATISRPMWSYGLENVPGILPPPKEGRLRHIAFAQLSILGVPDLAERAQRPEDRLGQWARGIPQWLTESMYFSPHYAPVSAVATMGKLHYALFPMEWTSSHLRQLTESKDQLDYVFTGALREAPGGGEMVIRLWEVRKLKERKAFNVRWTDATMDAELTKIHDQLRLFMEWSPYPEGQPVYTAPLRPSIWCQQLGAATSFFLADKGILPREQLALPGETLQQCATLASTSQLASLNWLTVRDRALRLGFGEMVAGLNPTLFDHPTVEAARQALGA